MQSGNRISVALALATLLFAVSAAHATVFEGHDKWIKLNQIKEKSQLSRYDKDILRASYRMGAINVCKWSRARSPYINAALIKVNGRPAIVTNAHALVSAESGLKCPLSKGAQQIEFYPNFSFYTNSMSAEDKAFVLRPVPVQYPPINAEYLEKFKNPSDGFDVAIFWLREDPTKDMMPDGTTRGHFKFANTDALEDRITFLGLAHSLIGNTEMIFSGPCAQGRRKGDLIRHTCPTMRGSSGGALLIYETGEFRLIGVNAGSHIEGRAPASLMETKPNVGISINGVLGR